MLLRGRGGKHFCAELRTVCKGFSSLIMIANFGFGFGFEIVVCLLLLVFYIHLIFLGALNLYLLNLVGYDDFYSFTND